MKKKLYSLTIGENSVKLTSKKDIQSARNIIRLKAYLAFVKMLSKTPKITFGEFQEIIRSAINHKAIGLTDKEFDISILKFGENIK